MARLLSIGLKYDLHQELPVAHLHPTRTSVVLHDLTNELTNQPTNQLTNHSLRLRKQKSSGCLGVGLLFLLSSSHTSVWHVCGRDGAACWLLLAVKVSGNLPSVLLGLEKFCLKTDWRIFIKNSIQLWSSCVQLWATWAESKHASAFPVLVLDSWDTSQQAALLLLALRPVFWDAPET